MTGWTGAAGKQVLITGATGGIGLAAAQALAARGAHVALVARSEDKARHAAQAVAAAAAPGARIEALVADLSSLNAVRGLAAEVLRRFPRLEILVNNAGAIYGRRQESPDGIELTWAVNHAAPFLLTALLLKRLKASAPARIIATSSSAHRGAAIPFDDLNAERSYHGFNRYSQSKLANILFTQELSRRLQGSGVEAACFHPGVVATGFGRETRLVRALFWLFQPFLRTPEQGARTLLRLAEAAKVEPGGYYVDQEPAEPSAAAQDPAAARRLWEATERLVLKP